MSLFKIFNVAGSGIHAQTTRLNAIASNLSNAESVAGSEAEAYRAKQAVFKAVQEQISADGMDRSHGVEVSAIVESQVPIQKQYSPQHPLADKDGFIYSSNVNAIEEMANMIAASRAYQNNVEVMKTAKTLALKTLQLGR